MKFFTLNSRYLFAVMIALAAAACSNSTTEPPSTAPMKTTPAAAKTTPAAAQNTPAAAQNTPATPAKAAEAMTYVDFKTSLGDFTAKLYTDKAPLTTANFIGLAEGTRTFIDANTGAESKRPFYNGLIFHRVIPNFMIQGGDPLGSGIGGPGYKFKDETDPSLVFDRPGLLAMANSGPNTNGSQFFVTVAPYPSLNGHYSLFGEVVKGQEVVNAIANVPRDGNDRPLTPVVMKEVKVYKVDAAGKPLPAGK